MTFSIRAVRKIAAAWGVALAISALLHTAGQHWPEPLPLRLGWILAALVLPALALGGWLLLQPVPDGDRGESDDRAQEPR
ncbi:MAG: hypothetical protein ACKOCM_12705 [Cyanobacteriota bacterium]